MLTLNLPNFYFWRRNKPVSSRSRWKKTLIRRNRHRTIVSASPRSVFMQVIEYPKTDEDRERIAAEQMQLLMTCGVVMAPAALLQSKNG